MKRPLRFLSRDRACYRECPPRSRWGLQTLGTDGHSGTETGPFILRAARPARAEYGIGPAWPATRLLPGSRIEATIWFQSSNPDSGLRLQPAAKFRSLATPASSSALQDPRVASVRKRKRTEGHAGRGPERREGTCLPARHPAAGFCSRRLVSVLPFILVLSASMSKCPRCSWPSTPDCRGKHRPAP